MKATMKKCHFRDIVHMDTSNLANLSGEKTKK